jgi:ABC-type bacteriocin/lantibiotic exporter with double-glycine peptidase domain
MKKKSLLVTFFKTYVKPLFLKQIVGFIYLGFFTLTNILFPYFLKNIIDEALTFKNIKILIIRILIMFSCGILMIIFNYLQSIKFITISQKIAYNLKKDVINVLMKSNGIFFLKNNSGKLFSILEKDISLLEENTSNIISNILINFCTFIGIMILFIIINTKIAIMLICLVVVFSFMQNKLLFILREKTKIFREQVAKIMESTQEIMQNILNIQILNLCEIFILKYSKMQKEYMKKYIELRKLIFNTSSINLFYNVFGITIVLLVGGYDVINDSLTVGSLFTLTIYVQKLYTPITKLVDSYVYIQQSKVILERIYKLLYNNDKIKSGTYVTNNIYGNIIFDRVNFKYTRKEIFNNLNISIKAGEHIGIVGENGSGKSSLALILSGIIEPVNGNVKIDGVDLYTYDIDFLHEIIGYASQKPFIFSGTLKENLLVGNSYSEKKLEEILDAVNLKKDIDEMPDGLNTFISESGKNLSGGQIQKIAIARVLLKNCKIIIFDECTSAFDLYSEKVLCKNISKLLKGKTFIVISHRKELLKSCSKIYKIVEKNIYLENRSAKKIY